MPLAAPGPSTGPRAAVASAAVLLLLLVVALAHHWRAASGLTAAALAFDAGAATGFSSLWTSAGRGEWRGRDWHTYACAPHPYLQHP